MNKIVVINKDETEIELTFEGLDRQVWFDEVTGKIEIIRKFEDIELGLSGSTTILGELGVFPEGVRNIRLEGLFGTDATAIVKLLQLFIMAKQSALIDPQGYRALDLVAETIGKYSYELSGKSTTRLQRKSIDEYIDFLFTCLPKENSMGLEAV